MNLWGTGRPKREFIYVDDLADACVFFMNKNTKEKIINIGSGKDNTILEISKLALKILNVRAKINFDNSKPDGTKRKVLDISVAKNMDGNQKLHLKREY